MQFLFSCIFIHKSVWWSQVSINFCREKNCGNKRETAACKFRKNVIPLKTKDEKIRFADGSIAFSHVRVFTSIFFYFKMPAENFDKYWSFQGTLQGDLEKRRGAKWHLKRASAAMISVLSGVWLSKTSKYVRKYTNLRGAFHSFEKAYEIFSAQKDFYGFLMDFSGKQKDFCQRRTRFFGVKCPSQIWSNLLQ